MKRNQGARTSSTPLIQADPNQRGKLLASIRDLIHRVRFQINHHSIQIAVAVAGIKNGA